MVVVVDPQLVDRAQLQDDLNAVALEERRRQSDSELLNVRVQAGCHTAAELLEASKTLQSRSWHPDASKASYASYLDARTSTYHLTFATTDRALGEALVNQLGDRVTVQYGSVGRLLPTPS